MLILQRNDFLEWTNGAAFWPSVGLVFSFSYFGCCAASRSFDSLAEILPCNVKTMPSAWQLQQQALTDMARYPHLPRKAWVSALPLEERNADVLRIYEECAQYAKLVYVCYFCSQFIVGGCCFAHHSVTCARNYSYLWYVPVRITACSFRWINCSHCAKQALIASGHTLIPHVKLTLHWARITAKLFEREQQLAAWRCAARLPGFKIPLIESILSFL